ncbi:MAG: hypothetical protein IT193_06935 [Propionibacteriaceae bacterium]|nr:hypothetical protein [Propionibacteriaceae bacterium]
MTTIESPTLTGFPQAATTVEGLGPVGRAALRIGIGLIRLADRARERREHRLEAGRLAGEPRYDHTRLLSQQERDRAIREGAFLFRGLQ